MRTWGGIVDVCPDASPIIGPDPGRPACTSTAAGAPAGSRRRRARLGVRPHHRHRRAAPDRRPFAPGALHHRRADRRARRRRRGPLMLLIPCPWCGLREEIGVLLRRRGHIARPADPAALSDDEWARVRVRCATTPRAWARALGAQPGLPALVQRRRAPHRHARDRRHLQAGRAGRRRAGVMTGLPPAARRPHRPRPAHRLPLRRALLPGLRRRHAGVGPAGQRRRRGRPQLQVPPPARLPLGRPRGAERAGPARRGAAPSPTCAPPRSSSTRALEATPRQLLAERAISTWRGAVRLASPLLVGRLLLQDLQVAEELLEAGLRAADPRRRRPGPRAPAATAPTPRPQHWHCDVLVVGAGPAGLAAALAAGGRRGWPSRA
jgi:sarcosine oxidase subunit alpha